MEHKASAVVALHQTGKKTCEILTALKSLGINRMFIYRTIKRFKESGSIKKRHGAGRKVSATCSRNIKIIRSRLKRNPRISMIKVAKETGLSRSSVMRICKKKTQD